MSAALDVMRTVAMVRAMNVIYLVLLIASAACFALAAFAPKRGGTRVNLIPLGLLLSLIHI